jgi:hypothetical protein
MWKCQFSIIPDFLTRVEFSTVDQSFQYVVISKKGRDVKMMEASFKAFKQKHNSPSTIRLYRTTKKRWCNIGNWYSYLFHSEWQYPYMDIIIL